MTNHLKIHIYTFILLSFTACFLTSCNEEALESFEVPEVTHTYKMKLNADFTGFDAKDGSTRATIHGWEDGDIVYLSFSTSGNNYVGGKATYDADNDDWTVTYSGTLTSTEQGSVKVYYFDGEVSDSTTLCIAPTVGIYADLSGSYKYSSEEGVYVSANLVPQTSRIRFKGTPEDSITISGIKSYTTYNSKSGTITVSSYSTPLHVASDGYTPYVYGVFADSDNPSICINNNGCKFTKLCSNSMFQIGESGWINVPTRVSHENWEMEDVSVAYVVLVDSNKDGVGETLIFYYDDVDHSQEGTVYSINTGNNLPEWQDMKQENKWLITKAIFDPSFAFAKPTTTYYWFYGFSNLISISGIKYLDTSNVTNMSDMFHGCKLLTEINIENFKTSNVTSMSNMFSECFKLAEINVSNFNTSKVTDMGKMFSSCWNITELNVSNFNTSNVTDMSGMFSGCSKLTELNVSNFSTSNVINMSGMFRGCFGLTELNLASFNTDNVTDMNYMFADCSGLTELDLSRFKTGNVTDMNSMFFGCSKLEALDLSNFDTRNVTDMNQIFSYCSDLIELNITSFNTENVTDMFNMFFNCSSLTSLELSNFNTVNVTNMGQLFCDCTKLTKLDVSSFNTSNVTDMQHMFSNCTRLTELNVSNFNTEKVIAMSYMFKGCSSLIDIDISMFDISYNNFIREMFSDCTSLSSINVGGNDFINADGTIFSGVGSASNPCNLIITTDFDISVLGAFQNNKYYRWRGGYFAEPTIQQSNYTYEYVDLGLPSGICWATTDLGSNDIYKNGNLYAWGETSQKFEYTIDNYTYNGGSPLPSSADAASVNMGEKWRMPTPFEWLELKENCTWDYDYYTNCDACLIGTSIINGKTITFCLQNCEPHEEPDARYYSCYWSKVETSSEYASYCNVEYWNGPNSSCSLGNLSELKYKGLLVRAVIEPSN